MQSFATVFSTITTTLPVDCKPLEKLMLKKTKMKRMPLFIAEEYGGFY